jgi:hypothetical protein
MRLVVKKMDVIDLGHLQSLVIEHIDGVEPGLTVLDSRLLLGHATVDVVALDAEGGLVLASVGFNADEEMLLKAVETYSWCLEYPEAIKRLYPAVEVSAARPPRLMFIVERLPDAFHRKIKQLGFCEVDCVEFRHLDVSGTPAAYFDTIARLRRGSAQAEFQPAPIARRVSEREPRRASEPLTAERTFDKIDRGDKVVPLVSAPTSARATSVRLQKMLNANGPGHGHGAAPVIDLATRTATTARAESPRVVEAPRVEALRVEAPAPRVEPVRVEPVKVATARVEARVEVEPEDAEPTLALPALELPTLELPTLEMPTLEMPTLEAPTLETPTMEIPVIETATSETPEALPVEVAVEPQQEPGARPEAPVTIPEPIARMTLRGAIPVPAPVAAAEPAPATEPKLSLAGIANELLGALTPKAAPEAEAPVVEEPAPVAPAPTPFKRVAKPATPAAQPAAPAAKPVVSGLKPITPDKPIAPTPKLIAPVAKPVVAAPKPVTPAAAPKSAVPAATTPAPKPAVAAAPAAVKPAAAATPAAAAPAPQPAAAETPAQNLPQEFEGLKFPNDGVLTRQWMEFLNQMASSK